MTPMVELRSRGTPWFDPTEAPLDAKLFGRQQVIFPPTDRKDDE
jgi:hypothetical protein